MIPFNVPPFTGDELSFIEKAIKNRKICGDGEYTKRCNKWLEEYLGGEKALLTTSCTHALEMAAILCDIKPGDEVIMPSFTFVSTANAFVGRGAEIKFVDIRPDTMNIDETLIESAITDKTKAVVPVHYAGVPCNMDKIMEIARKYQIFVVEDAAQAVMSYYKGRPCGAIGDFGCFSFHETKNYSMGEGGAIAIRNEGNIEKAEIIREKGTNRSKYFRGEIDKYTWVDYGSSYLPSELNAAYLWAQLLRAEEINKNRLNSWDLYYNGLKELSAKGYLDIPYIPDGCQHNAHMFYLKTRDLEERTRLIKWLKENEILAVFHYIPLHTSRSGMKFGQFVGQDVFTTKESDRLLRLPLYYGLETDKVQYIIDKIKEFYHND